ncbi:hypothetical protein [Algoriphagus machipongonensis]|uniref:Lipoprotein n=1 Tax=Algoriphagus machipongonensis TaxID=388413 RepID=A3HU80_9BACT|nr:hypothetical protein [Algoriphagus machipongonensis]EAZ81702.1 hypothetical protein ALPR1_00635 [Algoriphagus machipongonensis]
MNFKISLLLGFLVLGLFSCSGNQQGSEELETLPYFDLKGQMEQSLEGLEAAQVTKVSRINGEEITEEVKLSPEQWREELAVFFEADINKSSLVSAYDTQVKNEYLIHELYPDAKGYVKNITVSIINDEVHFITIKMSKENTFYSSVTNAEVYFNNVTKKIDHYAIETTQKIWFLKPNNIKIRGVLRF